MRKLLIVDDDEALRRLVCLELKDSYEIIESGEPDQGLALALEYNPDAILLDLRMPKYSGYELLRTFTSFSYTKQTPIIIVSGEGDAQTKKHCRELGAAAYFEKPIDFEALRCCLQQTAMDRPRTPRSEVRIRLRVPLKLKGTDKFGDPFDVAAMTEDVSLGGFLCECNAALMKDSFVDVYLTNPAIQYVGKAQVVHTGFDDDLIR